MQIFVYNAPREFITSDNNYPTIQFETNETQRFFVYSLEPSQYDTIEKTDAYFVINNSHIVIKQGAEEMKQTFNGNTFNGKTVFVINQNIDVLQSILPLVDNNCNVPYGFTQYIESLYNDATYTLK
jgi:hypothetical protein